MLNFFKLMWISELYRTREKLFSLQKILKNFYYIFRRNLLDKKLVVNFLNIYFIIFKFIFIY